MLQKLVISELDAAAAAHATPRRTVLIDGDVTIPVPDSLEVPDRPCRVVLTAQGLLARTDDAQALPGTESETGSTAIAGSVDTTTRGTVAVVTSTGRAHRVDVLELPMTSSGHSVAGAPVSEYCSLDRGEKPVGVMAVSAMPVESSEGTSGNRRPTAEVLAIGTAQGVVKRLSSDVPADKDIWEIISLKAGDRVVCAANSRDDDRWSSLPPMHSSCTSG